MTGTPHSPPARPALVELTLGDPPERWEALGFAVTGGRIALGGVEIRLTADAPGIAGWALSGIDPVADIDGLPTEVRGAPGTLPGVVHPNGAVGLDHVVVTTPDFDRTVAALTAAGLAPRRIREVGNGESGFRQAFRRLGPAILEIVEAKTAPPGPARFWGLVAIVSDLDALAERLGPERLAAPKPAVQPGRRIATLRRGGGLGQAMAFMTPEANAVTT